MHFDPSQKTDEDLVELTIKDQEFFAHIMNRYEGKLSRYIKRLSNYSPEETEDVLQDVFIKVYKNINDFDTDLKFSSWIYRITHNEVISNHRKKKRRPESAPGEENDIALGNIISEINTEKEVDTKMLNKSIYEIFKKMDDKYRDVLVLNYFEEKSYKEISDILKKPMGTIAALLNRAKKDFKKELEKSDIKLA
jgi:RNA polymerase sigma-70 factor (ECF subfamily)